MTTLRKNMNILLWSEIDKWTSTASFLRFPNIPGSWERIRVGDIVAQTTEKIKVNNDDKYKLAGVRWYGKGVFHRETVKGKESSATWFYPLVPGALIYNRLFAWKESFAIVPKELEDHYVSNEFPQFIALKNILLPEYLNLVFNTTKVINAVKATSIGSSAISRNRFKEEDFLSFIIPLPPRIIQDKIIKYWESTQLKIADWDKDIENWENELADIVLEKFDIKIEMGTKLPKIFKSNFSNSERWGVAFNRYSWDLKSLIMSSKYPKEALGNFAWINPSNAFEPKPDDDVTFIPMESVYDKSGHVVSPYIKKFKQVKSGFTRFKNGDVIWAKITPCMQNGKSAVMSDLVNGVGFGSTEFHVIRSKNKTILKSEYIHLLLRIPQIRQAATRHFVGSAGQQRVPKEFLEKLHIPIMPIDDQKKLISLVEIEREKIENQRRKLISLREESKKTVEEIILGLRSVDGI